MADIILRGAINRPGVGSEENLGEKAITGGPLGFMALVGKFARGKVGAPIVIDTPEKATTVLGGDLWDELTGAFLDFTPDAARGYIKASRGVGGIVAYRLEGDAAGTASRIFPSRKAVASGGGDSLQVDAGSPGAAGGQQATHTDTAASVTETTVVLSTPGTIPTNRWRGALVVNTTRSHSFVCTASSGGTLTAPAGSQLVTDHSYAGTDAIEIYLYHSEEFISAEVRESMYGDDFFALNIYVDGAQRLSYPRLTMDPASPHYAIDVVNQDPANRDYVVLTDKWLAASKAYSTDANPVVERGVLSAITTTTLTVGSALFPTKNIDGFDFVGMVAVHPGSGDAYRIISNTATQLTFPAGSDAATTWGADTGFWILDGAYRLRGGYNDHSGVGAADYVDAFTASVTGLDRIELGGTLFACVPGISGFAAATRKAVHDAGLAYCMARGWEWVIETDDDITGGEGKTLEDVGDDRDVIFGSGGNNLDVDSPFATINAVSWQRVVYPEHGGAMAIVPTVGDMIGLIAWQATRTRGYTDPAAGIIDGLHLPRAAAIDLDDEDSDVNAILDRYSLIGFNFIIPKRGRFVPWGARTAQRSYPAWAFAHRRRQMSHIILSLTYSRVLEEAVFRPSTAALRGEVVGQIAAFLRPEWEAGRLDNDLPFDEAVSIYAGLDLNDEAARAAGLLYVKVVLAFPGIAERVRLQMSQRGVSFTL